MLRSFLSIVLGIGAVAGAQAMTPLAAEPVTTVAQGDYALARLELPAGLAGKPQQLILALRQGKLVNFWFVTPEGGDKRLHLEESTLQRQGDTLNGKTHIRTVGKIGRASGYLVLDLKLDGEKLSGQYELAMEQTIYTSAKGTASGVLQTKAPAQDALAPKASWTNFWGSSLDMSAGAQPPLVDDFAAGRPVWRSEVYVLTGYGNAPDSRYFTRALTSGNGGGGSSPVVADGTVYIYQYVPSPGAEPALRGNPYWERTFKSDEAFKEAMAKANASPREVGWVLNHFRPLADDMVVAMDAATGATRWTAVMPLRSANVQTHKHRGVSGVPLVAGDILFVPNFNSRLYALDRGTGKLLWESPAGAFTPATGGKSNGPANPSPIMMAGNLIWAHGGLVFGLDPATGKEKWKAPGGYLMPWTSGGRQRLVSVADYGKTLLCLDAADGKVIWKQEATMLARAPLSAVISGDLLLVAPLGEKGTKLYYTGWQLSDTGAKQVWQDEHIANDENIPVTLADGKAYLLGAQYIRILDVATGKKVGERKFEGGSGPGSNPWLGVLPDRFLFYPEGQHGAAHYGFLDRELKTVGSMWAPTHTSTTAYNSQPIVTPIVDGRAFIRGGDGIYCYDLRKH